MRSSIQREREGGNGGGSCQDCGNKAKRECEHLRCRTCCRSRGLHCPTHVKSTWVPVTRRRHHHHRLSLPPPFSAFLHLTSPNSSSSGLLQGRRNQSLFPAEVKTVANFRQVWMNSGDNAVDQAAYHTSVNIGGHLFNGILYDQGQCSGEGSSADHQYQLHHQQHHQLAVGTTPSAAHLGDGARDSPSDGANPGPYSNPNPHEYSFGAPPFSVSLSGMQFFPHPKP